MIFFTFHFGALCLKQQGSQTENPGIRAQEQLSILLCWLDRRRNLLYFIQIIYPLIGKNNNHHPGQSDLASMVSAILQHHHLLAYIYGHIKLLTLDSSSIWVTCEQTASNIVCLVIHVSDKLLENSVYVHLCSINPGAFLSLSTVNDPCHFQFHEE